MVCFMLDEEELIVLEDVGEVRIFLLDVVEIFLVVHDVEDVVFFVSLVVFLVHDVALLCGDVFRLCCAPQEKDVEVLLFDQH